MTYLIEFALFLPHTFVIEVIMVDTNKIIKIPGIYFGKFLRFIGIWMLMTSNPVTNGAEYFSEKPIDIFSGRSICVKQFMSGNCFESIWSALKFTNTHTPLLLRSILSSRTDDFCVERSHAKNLYTKLDLMFRLIYVCVDE